MGEVSGEGRSTREINTAIRREMQRGETDIVVRDPGAKHNLGVAVIEPVSIRFDGSVGYYCGGLIDGPHYEIVGSAGWGLAESMLNGHVVVRESVGNGAAAALRGGTVVVHGDAAARLGVSMKGGTVLVAGNCGYMAGFMGQKGTIVVCGDAGPAFADSMYETVCFVGGRIAELGTDAVIEPLGPKDVEFLETALAEHLPEHARRGMRRAREFKRVVAGRKLWNFDNREWKLWQEAL